MRILIQLRAILFRSLFRCFPRALAASAVGCCLIVSVSYVKSQNLPPAEMNAETAVVKGPVGGADKQEPIPIAPATVLLKPNGEQTFTVTFPQAGEVVWSALDDEFKASAAAGTIDAAGKYVAPAQAGVFYVKAVSNANLNALALATVIVTAAETQVLFRDDFNGDAALPLVDENKDGVPDYTENPDGKVAMPPQLKNAQVAATSNDKPKMIVNAGPGGGIRRLDVVSTMDKLLPGGFSSNALLVADEANWSMGFGIKWGDPAVEGVLSLSFYDAATKGNGLYIELGDQGADDQDARTMNPLASLLLRNGKIEFGGKKSAYEVSKAHALEIQFSQTDTTAGADGTYRVKLDGAEVGSAGFLHSGVPSRFSLHAAGAGNMTKGFFFIDDLGVSGILAPVAPQVAATPVQVTVDWTKTLGKVLPINYSLNVFQGFSPKNSNDPAYQQNIAYMKPGLLRFHSWNMLEDAAKKPDGWLDVAGNKWDAAKIGEAMAGWKSYPGEILMNIPGWPAWFKRTGKAELDPSEYDRYAEFCADLVRIINVDAKAGVKYWEITNEQDETYWVQPAKNKTPDKLEELAIIYNKCAVAMKKVDPTIKTGGPAVAKGDEYDNFRRFVKAALPNMDFFSFHAYMSGSPSDADEKIYDKAAFAISFGGRIRKILNEESPDRHIESHFNEYNISWSWRTRESRMTNYKGAVFDALLLAGIPQSGIDVSCAWNEKDGIYGKMGPENELRPSAHVFHFFNENCVGDVVASTSSNNKRVVPFAVKSDQGRTIVLINRSPKVQPVRLSFGGDPPGMLKRQQISKAGLAEIPAEWAQIQADGLYLPEHSVTFLIFPK